MPFNVVVLKLCVATELLSINVKHHGNHKKSTVNWIRNFYMQETMTANCVENIILYVSDNKNSGRATLQSDYPKYVLTDFTHRNQQPK
jgi:hypothetical protein